LQCLAVKHSFTVKCKPNLGLASTLAANKVRLEMQTSMGGGTPGCGSTHRQTAMQSVEEFMQSFFRERAEMRRACLACSESFHARFYTADSIQNTQRGVMEKIEPDENLHPPSPHSSCDSIPPKTSRSRLMTPCVRENSFIEFQ